MAELEQIVVDNAFNFLQKESDTPDMLRKEFVCRTFEQYALMHFEDRNAIKYICEPLKRPLLKRDWDSLEHDKALTLWVNILRFLGDIPPRKQNPQTNLQICRTLQLMTRDSILLRDELYCQLCRQLSNNPTKASEARGWVLMALLVSNSLPSEKLRGPLLNFIQKGPLGFAKFVHQLFMRTKSNGPRSRPCCLADLHFVMAKRPFSLVVDCYVSKETIKVDPSITVGEALDQILCTSTLKFLQNDPTLELAVVHGSKKHIQHFYGNKSLLMDHIAEHEYSDKTLGVEDDWRKAIENLPFRVILRRKVFMPWWEDKDPSVDFCYRQVLDGITKGVYTIAHQKFQTVFLAYFHFVEFGPSFNEEKLKKELEKKYFIIPADSYEGVLKKVRLYLETPDFVATIEDAKKKLVDVVTSVCSLDFCDVYTKCGAFCGDMAHPNVNIGVNSQGLVVLAEGSKFMTGVNPLATLPFVQMASISPCAKDPKEKSKYIFEISCVGTQDAKFKITGFAAINSLQKLLSRIHMGLCQRSLYCMAMLPYKSPSVASMFLSFNQGDLISLPVPWGEADQGGWCTGKCERTAQSGDFPSANVYVLPSITKPSAALIELYVAFCGQAHPQASAFL